MVQIRSKERICKVYSPNLQVSRPQEQVLRKGGNYKGVGVEAKSNLDFSQLHQCLASSWQLLLQQYLLRLLPFFDDKDEVFSAILLPLPLFHRREYIHDRVR